MSTRVPVRICCACRQRSEKDNLIRIGIDDKGEIKTDPKMQIQSRGAYVCRRIECIQMAAKRHSVERTLKVPSQDEIYIMLQKEVNDETR